MLVWINGPFGGGKTQTAHELVRRLPASVLCDPEELGFGLARMAPAGLVADFQDWSSWRVGVVEVLDRALRAGSAAGYDHVIVAMTVVEPAYFAETVGELRRRGHEVAHFALMAERATVVRRLRERVPLHGLVALARRRPRPQETFAMGNLDRGLERLAGPEFAQHIRTDDIAVPAVAERIAAAAGLTLRPNTDGTLRARARLAWTGLRHVRWR